MIIKLSITYLTTSSEYLILMGRMSRRPERMRMFFKHYVKKICQLGVDSISLVLLISFFIGTVICIQMKINIQSPWIPRWTTGYITREIFLLESASASVCLILARKVGSNITSELGTTRMTQQIDAFDIMGVNPASYLILSKITGLITIMPFLIIFSSTTGTIGAYGIAHSDVLSPDDLTVGFQYLFDVWFVQMSIIKSVIFAFIITNASSFYSYSVRGGSIKVGEASANVVVSSSMLALFADVFLIPLLN